MRYARILALLLALLFALGLAGCEEEGEEAEETAEVIPSKPGTFSAVPGEWVTYAVEEAGEVTLALIGEEEHGGVPGYWLELVVPEEDQKVVVKVLVEKEAYEEFGKEVVEWLQKPEIPQEGLLAGAMATAGMETAEEDLKAGLEEFNRIVMRLLVEAEGQAFEIDLPSFTRLIGDQAAAGMEMAAEMAEAYGGEVPAEEVALPTFELVR
ncbi:MAG TPA: hypothetical protein ENN88_02015, partial [Candidatus Coatesbacteria bacterium]|nr:hypothetical protein [Candidatus Coatesbacteria bacterium]